MLLLQDPNRGEREEQQKKKKRKKPLSSRCQGFQTAKRIPVTNNYGSYYTPQKTSKKERLGQDGEK